MIVRPSETGRKAHYVIRVFADVDGVMDGECADTDGTMFHIHWSNLMTQHNIHIDLAIFHLMCTVLLQWGLIGQRSADACMHREPWWRSTLQMD
jgi:hypothetical protein